MGKDRQQRKLRESKRVGPDRDQALHFGGSTKTEQELKNEGK